MKKNVYVLQKAVLQSPGLQSHMELLPHTESSREQNETSLSFSFVGHTMKDVSIYQEKEPCRKYDSFMRKRIL